MLKLLIRDDKTQDVWITPNHNADKRFDDFHREVKPDIIGNVPKQLKNQFGDNFDIEISNGEIYLVSQTFDIETGKRRKIKKGTKLNADDYFEKVPLNTLLAIIGSNLENAKQLAIEYKVLTGKSLGITGEVAEFEAATKLNCTLCIARNPGFDIMDTVGNKVQVKGRIVGDNIQRVGTILENSSKKPWDYVLLVLLDENYELLAIYKASEEAIEDEIRRERPKGGKSRRDMTIPDFVKIGHLVWPVP